MFSPQKCLSQVIPDNPEDVDRFYDLLNWIRSAKGIMELSEVDELMASIYGKTTDGLKHRHDYDKRNSRVRHRVTVEESESKFPA